MPAKTTTKNETAFKRPFIETDRTDWLLWSPKNLLFIALCTGCRQSQFSRNKVVCLNL